jgi:hypothetical protein
MSSEICQKISTFLKYLKIFLVYNTEYAEIKEIRLNS